MVKGGGERAARIARVSFSLVVDVDVASAVGGSYSWASGRGVCVCSRLQPYREIHRKYFLVFSISSLTHLSLR